MKKFAIVLVMFLIILNGVKEESQFSLLNYFSGDYVAYTSEIIDKSSFDLGFCYINSKPVKNYIIGESIVISDCEISSVLKVLKAKVVKTEYLQDSTTIIYAFTNLINDKVDVFGKTVNLQIAFNEDRTTIGWPLILGSF